MKNEVEKKKLGRTKRTPLDVLRTKLWFGWVWRLVFYGSLSETIKTLAARISIDSERLFYKYAKGQNSPSGFYLSLFETAYPGSRAVFENGFCNLFPILEARTIKEAVRLLTEAVTLEHEAMPDQMCCGETTLDWLQNISQLLAKRAIQEEGLLPLALVAGICEMRFLDKTTTLSEVADSAVVYLCQSYPGLTREDIVAAIPEVAEALARGDWWAKLLNEMFFGPTPPPPPADPRNDAVIKLFVDFFDSYGHQDQREQLVKFGPVMDSLCRIP